MIRVLAVAALIAGASGLHAQGMPGAAAKRAAQKAVDAANAQLSAQTGQAVPKPGGPTRQETKPVPPTAKPATSELQAGKGARLSVRAPKDSVPAIVMREIFEYAANGRRDPFVSLLTTSDLRPALSDLRLMGILYDMSGRRPIAIMRDASTNAQYRVTTGQTLGRMRVAQIRPKVIVFTIEEFGLNRQDSLVLGDTTKVRSK
jgi:hypothetical protein